MQTNDNDGPVLPLLVYDSRQTLCHAGLINTKGLNKSLENGQVWVLDGSSGRLLPLADQNPEYAESLRQAGRAPNARCLSTIERQGQVVVARLELALGLVLGQALPEQAAIITAKSRNTVDPELDGGKIWTADERAELANFLFTLQDLIRQRKIDLPVGSYTTHLFKSGGSKIRKKTGEEAVELILASDVREIASEASDLIYHMLVLFADSGVSLEAVLEELKKR